MTIPQDQSSTAVAYMRCSGESQIQGDTWSRQEAAISKYAKANGITVLEWFRDEGVTGKMELEGRVGLSACIDYVRTHDIKLALVEDSTRLARDLIVSEVVVREFQKIGVRVVASAGGVDLTEGDESNPTAKLIRQILAAVSEFERCCIVIKMKGARDRIRVRDGRCEGRKSFGMLPGEVEVLATMHRFRLEGCTYKTIASNLNALEYPTRSGGKWLMQTVAKILDRSLN